METPRRDKLRFLSIALIFSGALNIGLMLTLGLTSFEDSGVSASTVKLEDSQAVGLTATNQELLGEMLKLSFSELVVYLTNRTPLEEGYTQRDLALSALVASHHFNLRRALPAPFQRRSVPLSPEQTIEMYPGLTDEQYEAIIRYAYQEKWPLTSKGLFQMLAKLPKPLREQSLCEAFFATPEFYSIQTLFQKTEASQDLSVLLDLVVEGSWNILDRFAAEQASFLDLSVERRRALLFDYLSLSSSLAAELLLRTDFLFAKTRLADSGVLLLINALRVKSPHAERFCTDLLRSPRTDAVWRAAAQKLYSFIGEKMPEPFDLQAILSRFSLSSLPAPEATKPPSASKPVARLLEHTVQEGENLWKISRQYKVKVEDLIQHNGLEQDRLLPGMVLSIP